MFAECTFSCIFMRIPLRILFFLFTLRYTTEKQNDEADVIILRSISIVIAREKRTERRAHLSFRRLSLPMARDIPVFDLCRIFCAGSRLHMYTYAHSRDKTG